MSNFHFVSQKTTPHWAIQTNTWLEVVLVMRTVPHLVNCALVIAKSQEPLSTTYAAQKSRPPRIAALECLH